MITKKPVITLSRDEAIKIMIKRLNKESIPLLLTSTNKEIQSYLRKIDKNNLYKVEDV